MTKYDPFEDARELIGTRWKSIGAAPFRVERDAGGVRYFFRWRTVEVVVNLFPNKSDPFMP